MNTIVCRILIVIFWLLAAPSINAQQEASFGILYLTIIDAGTGEETPARVEVTDSNGNTYTAKDAMPIAGECGGNDNPVEKKSPVTEPLDVALSSNFRKTTINPYTGMEQFYSIGQSLLKLPAGAYNIKIYKGPEYRTATTKVDIKAGREIKQKINLTRFANMPAKGWYSSDVHTHIARTNPGVDPLILKLMQAEDINVGNILLVTRPDALSLAPQYAFGPDSVYQEGNHLIATGQEGPRTHILGHAITLGAKEAFQENDNYLIYRLMWEKAAKQGAINGFGHSGAHGFVNYVPSSGLPLVVPHGLMSFMEVMQSNRGGYDAWYDMLNLGFRITPTAGTDYMCAGLPGNERFYTRIEGPFTHKNWLDGVRKGRTFVTTGPLLEFRVNGKDIGDEITLSDPAVVTIEGEVQYDPNNDSQGMAQSDIEKGFVIGLELIENGDVVQRFARVDDSGVIKFKINHKILKSSWLALRTIHVTSLETSMGKKAAIAHTAPIYVTVKNTPLISAQPKAKAIARDWLASLDLLEQKFNAKNIEHLLTYNTTSDAVSKGLLLNSRIAIMEEIETSRAFFKAYLGK